jgi:menaquinone-dependent protoporphyrinogen IX oxidase
MPLDGPARVLVTYASRMGSTAEIGEAIAERLRAAGLDVTVVPVG